MKKLISILVVLLILLLSGCTMPKEAEEGYRYVENGNESYLILDSKTVSATNQGMGSVGTPMVTFSTMSEMKNDIKTGTFTENETINISKFKRNDAGKISTCSIDKLWEPSLPAGHAVKELMRINWYGEYYWFEINTDSYFLEICCATEEYAEFQINQYFEEYRYVRDYDNKEICTVAPGVEATVYHVSYSGPRRVVLYTFEHNEITYHVSESYKNNNRTPEIINIIGMGNSFNFIANVYALSDEFGRYKWSGLSFDEISNIGLKQFVEKETA